MEVIVKDLNNRLQKLIKNWDPEIKWGNKELTVLTEKLSSLIETDINFLYSDRKIQKEEILDYLVKTIIDSIHKILRIYCQNAVGDLDNGYYLTRKKSFLSKESFNFLECAEYKRKIDVNSAGIEELASLPGIGKITAKRIFQYRMSHGDYSSVEDLKHIEGISSDDIKLLENKVTFKKRPKKWMYTSELLEEFRKNTTFSNYIRLIKETKGSFLLRGSYGKTKRHYPVEGEIKDVIRHEIEKIIEILGNQEMKRSDFFKSSSEIWRYSLAAIMRRKLDEISVQDVIGVSILSDSDYVHFLKKALDRAKKRIFIVMFFMLAKDGSYPVNDVIERLIEAHKQGVEVKVILDKDAEGDIYKSRIINSAACKKFKKAGVKVVHDSELYLTHSKLVLIDDIHTIIGSHNWTAGSFYAYDDKSMYIESREFNRRVGNYFLHLWNIYKGNIPIEIMRTLDKKILDKLITKNIKLTKQLYKIIRTRKGRERLSKDINWNPQQLMKTANILDLMRLDGINEGWAMLLERLGVDTVRELASRNPDNLYKMILEYPWRGTIERIAKRKPTMRQVQYWIKKAKRTKSSLEY
ncbi:MAG: DUF4332 domain-containing protein [Candidatus Helarchaeota archaeon]|nr:DUF4332 domain-containing protein [Candidatus Helarchaeota archaeon]